MILESKPLHKKKKRLARKTKDQGSDGSPQVRLSTINIKYGNSTSHTKDGKGLFPKETPTTLRKWQINTVQETGENLTSLQIMWKVFLNINLRLILGWFILPWVDHTCLLKGVLSSQCSSLFIKESWPLVPFGPLTGDKLLLSLSFKCVWSAVKKAKDTCLSSVLHHLHQNKWAACLLHGWGKKKNAIT